jgi:hypothetical protein
LISIEQALTAAMNQFTALRAANQEPQVRILGLFRGIKELLLAKAFQQPPASKSGRE